MNKKIYIAAVALSLFASCAKDEDSPTLNTDDRDQFVGNWICTEKNLDNLSTTSFSINITKSGTGDTVVIENFANYGSAPPQAYALISGNSMPIPTQNITNTSILIKEASGIMSNGGNKITMNYKADNVGYSATCVR